jgi:hypothetical protein
MRHASEELRVEGLELVKDLDQNDIGRLLNVNARCVDKWIENKHYSPDRAEKFRAAAREKLYAQEESGVKS